MHFEIKMQLKCEYGFLAKINLNRIMILKMYMCNKFEIEITLQYNKAIMCKILKICVLKYFVIIIYIIMWGGDWMVKVIFLGLESWV